MVKVLPFPWYGGKYSYTSFVYENLADTHRYVEPFCGSSVVLINKPQAPVETINDLNSNVVNFFEVLQTDKEELIERLKYTPYSREVFEKAKKQEYTDNIQQAIYFLVRTTQSYSCNGRSWAKSTKVARRGKSQKVSLWQKRREYVEQTAERIAEVQIENKDAKYVCETYDTDETTFYCDPPYPPDCRKEKSVYDYEMGEDEHRELADVLTNLDGYVALSSYESELLNELYDGWNIIYDREKELAGKNTGSRTEVLYTNYDPEEVDTVE